MMVLQSAKVAKNRTEQHHLLHSSKQSDRQNKNFTSKKCFGSHFQTPRYSHSNTYLYLVFQAQFLAYIEMKSNTSSYLTYHLMSLISIQAIGVYTSALCDASVVTANHRCQFNWKCYEHTYNMYWYIYSPSQPSWSAMMGSCLVGCQSNAWRLQEKALLNVMKLCMWHLVLS